MIILKIIVIMSMIIFILWMINSEVKRIKNEKITWEEKINQINLKNNKPKEYYLKNYLYNDKYYIDVYFQEVYDYGYVGGCSWSEGFDNCIVIDVYNLNHEKIWHADHLKDFYKGRYKEFIEYQINKYEKEINDELQDELALEELKNMGCGNCNCQ